MNHFFGASLKKKKWRSWRSWHQLSLPLPPPPLRWWQNRGLLYCNWIKLQQQEKKTPTDLWTSRFLVCFFVSLLYRINMVHRQALYIKTKCGWSKQCLLKGYKTVRTEWQMVTAWLFMTQQGGIIFGRQLSDSFNSRLEATLSLWLKVIGGRSFTVNIWWEISRTLGHLYVFTVSCYFTALLKSHLSLTVNIWVRVTECDQRSSLFDHFIFQSDLRLITSAWQGHGRAWSMSLSCGFAHFLPISERIPANIGSDKVDAGTVREMAGISCDWFCPFSRGVQWKSGLFDQRSTTHLLWQTLPVWPHTVGSENQKKKKYK